MLILLIINNKNMKKKLANTICGTITMLVYYIVDLALSIAFRDNQLYCMQMTAGLSSCGCLKSVIMIGQESKIIVIIILTV